MTSLCFDFLVGLQLLDGLLFLVTVAQRQLGGRIAQLYLVIGGEGDKCNWPAIHQRPLGQRWRVIEGQLLDSRIEQLLLTLCNLGKAQIRRRRSFLLLLDDLLQIELSNYGLLGVLCIREEGLKVLVLLLTGEHAEDRVGDHLQEGPPQLFDLFIDLQRPFLDPQLLEGRRRETDVFEQPVEVALRCVHESGLREVQFLNGGNPFLGDHLTDAHDQHHQFAEYELRSAPVDSLHEVPQSRVRIHHLPKPPLLHILLQRVEAILRVELFVDGEAALRVTDALLLLGFEEHLEHINHAACIENSAVFREELAGDGRKPLISVLARTTTRLDLRANLTHYTIIRPISINSIQYPIKLLPTSSQPSNPYIPKTTLTTLEKMGIIIVGNKIKKMEDLNRNGSYVQRRKMYIQFPLHNMKSKIPIDWSIYEQQHPIRSKETSEKEYIRRVYDQKMDRKIKERYSSSIGNYRPADHDSLIHHQRDVLTKEVEQFNTSKVVNTRHNPQFNEPLSPSNNRDQGSSSQSQSRYQENRYRPEREMYENQDPSSRDRRNSEKDRNFNMQNEYSHQQRNYNEPYHYDRDHRLNQSALYAPIQQQSPYKSQNYIQNKPILMPMNPSPRNYKDPYLAQKQYHHELVKQYRRYAQKQPQSSEDHPFRNVLPDRLEEFLREKTKLDRKSSIKVPLKNNP